MVKGQNYQNALLGPGMHSWEKIALLGPKMNCGHQKCSPAERGQGVHRLFRSATVKSDVPRMYVSWESCENYRILRSRQKLQKHHFLKTFTQHHTFLHCAPSTIKTTTRLINSGPNPGSAFCTQNHFCTQKFILGPT